MLSSNKIDDLLGESDALENIAQRAQSEESTQEGAIELRDRYQQWYAEALTFLPDSSLERFREQYEGTLIKPRIKQYVQDPHKKWALYDWMPRPLKSHGIWQYPFETCFREPFREQKNILKRASGRRVYPSETFGTFEALSKMSRRLPAAMSVLQRPIHGRPGLPMGDEYDLQRILHALLVIHFDDVRAEETTPSWAGNSYRIDFLLRKEGIAVEAKMMNRSLTRAKVKTQLVDDIFGYGRHSEVRGLFALVYDPERQIDNSDGFSDDLSDSGSLLPVRVVVVHG